MLYNLSQADSRPVNSCRACMTTACLTGTSGLGPAAGKLNWHPDRCGFFDRLSQTGFRLVQERGLQLGRICACCHCITWRMRKVSQAPSSNACAPHDIGSTSKVLRVRVRDEIWTLEELMDDYWCRRISQEPNLAFRLAGHNPFGC
jgi:hypothetical protein